MKRLIVLIGVVGISASAVLVLSALFWFCCLLSSRQAFLCC